MKESQPSHFNSSYLIIKRVTIISFRITYKQLAIHRLIIFVI